jgi:hypothetical protein
MSGRIVTVVDFAPDFEPDRATSGQLVAARKVLSAVLSGI